MLPPSLKTQAELIVKYVDDGLLPAISVVAETPSEAAQQTPKTSFYRFHGKIVKFLDLVKKKFFSFFGSLLLKTLIKADRHLFARSKLCFLNLKLKLLGDSAFDHSLARRCPMKYYEALNRSPTPS